LSAARLRRPELADGRQPVQPLMRAGEPVGSSLP